MLKLCLMIFSCVIVFLLLTPSTPCAQDKPIQVSLFTPVQIFPEETSISGVRLNLLYGRNASVTGLDLGLVNHTTAGESVGLQYGIVGLVETDFVGWQDNAVNIVQGHFEGFQWGIVNHARSASGFQLGLVNYAGTMRGLQIGLVNIIRQNGAFPVFPIVNWSF